MKITIFGKGNMGKAIGDNFDACGNEVEYAGSEFIGELGDIIVLAVLFHTRQWTGFSENGVRR